MALLLAGLLSGAAPSTAQNVRYVNASVVGGAHDGSSWSSAFATLQDALAAAQADPTVTQVWVAAGAYYPDRGGGQNLGNRLASFRLRSGLAVYGGFVGGETQLDQRDFRVHETILSGDLGGNDGAGVKSDNTYRIVEGSFANATGVLDGFTIRGGYADASSSSGQVGGGLYLVGGEPTVRNCVFSGNFASDAGAAVYAYDAKPSFSNCTFADNITAESGVTGGGALLSSYASSITFTNCAFLRNASDYGGAVDVWHGQVTAINCTFIDNHAYISGGGVECSYDPTDPPFTAAVTLVNCILWGNTAAVSGAQIAQVLGPETTIAVSFSNVAGGQAGIDLAGGGQLYWDSASNLATNPFFADAAGRLAGSSACIDRGDSTIVATTTDLDGNPRLGDGGGGLVVDMGAYEYHAACGEGAAGVTLMDWDADGDVDLHDYDAFFTCLTGPTTALGPGCIVFDLDGDCDVDLIDYNAFQSTFSAVVQQPPALCMSPSTLNLGSSTNALSFTIWNCGGGQLDYSVAENTGWLSISPAGGTSAGEQDTLVASVNRGGLAEGSYQAEVTVTPNVGTPLTLLVAMTVGGCCSSPAGLANRTSGVAPLAIVFDAADPASGVVQPADGDYGAYQYVWDFGDPTSGNWPTDGLSRNMARGYVAAHVFENPGTYTVTLDVTAPDGQTTTYEEEITVTDPATETGWKTYYVSDSDGSNTNDGRSPNSAFKTFAKAMSMIGSRTRILFKRGDAWTTSVGANLNVPGPGIIGAYGGGPQPKIVITGPGYAFRFSGADWRIMDLEVVGPGVSSSDSGIAGSTSPVWLNGLVLRATISGFRVGIGHSSWLLAPHDGNVLAECHVKNAVVNGGFVGGKRLAIVGCRIENINESHALRVWQAHHAVIAHNVLWNPGPTRHALKLHGPAFGDGRPETQFVVVSDNDTLGRVWPVAIGPQGADADERISQVLFERNLLRSESSVQVGLMVWARDVTVRNNVFDGTGASTGYTAVSVGPRGIEPPPVNVRILNNTMYRGDAGSEVTMVRIQVAQNTTVRNNLGSAPNVATRTILSGSGSNLVADHNLFPISAQLANPAAGDFSLLSASPAKDAGVDLVHIFEDMVGTPRPQGPVTDIGAFEYVP